MKLGALGLATVVIGVVLSVPGLIGIGAFWVVMGAVAYRLRPRLTAKPPAGEVPESREFALGVAVLVGVGSPSLVVGILGLGIDDAHAAWRWLPLGVGILALGFGALSGLLYAAGYGLTSAAAEDQ